ncbi:hypothetical protein Bca52824_036081 [Brassica carinata]|uniref:Uncharacterized protein n=1 Tax=Brassica carinata TaxID=52824 RepID=A0A8X7V2B1_BRACI|nr:hypothetical protein Bca52824_036081 [Brassica carinata]
MLFIEEKAKLFQDSVKVHRLVVPFLSIMPSKASGKKIFAKADDIQNQAQPLEEALNRIYIKIENLAMPFLTLLRIEDVTVSNNNLNSRTCRSEPVVEYKRYSLQKNTSLVTVIGNTFDQLVSNCPENVLLEVSGADGAKRRH